jgi:branched-chain amino acid transport system substrate-binding protein
MRTRAALAYDALKFLVEAIQKSGTTEGPSLRDALAATKNFAGVTVILKLQEGKYICQETIQPEAFSS